MSMKLEAEVAALKQRVEALEASLTATIAAAEERLSELERDVAAKRPRKDAKAH